MCDEPDFAIVVVGRIVDGLHVDPEVVAREITQDGQREAITRDMVPSAPVQRCEQRGKRRDHWIWSSRARRPLLTDA